MACAAVFCLLICLAAAHSRGVKSAGSAADARDQEQPDASATKHGNRFSRDSVLRASSTGQGRADRAGTEPLLANASWRELVRNDKSASALWDATDRHVGFGSRDESVEDCLDEFRDKRRAIAPYVLSATVRENAYFLRDFIHNMSKYSHWHNLHTVQHYYDRFREILKDHRSYHTALIDVIEHMDPDMTQAIICAQRRFCSCFSQQDIARYEQQFSSLSQYNYLLRGYLLCGYYIDPIIRAIFIVTGLVLNCTTLTIFAKHKATLTHCDAMVMNIAVTGMLTLVVYMPLHYVHFYYSSILPHAELSDNGSFAFAQSALVSLGAASLLALRALRHVQMSHPLKGASWQRLLGILAVWAWALSVATLTYAFNDDPHVGFLFAPAAYIVLYVLFLPAATRRLRIHFEKGSAPPEGEELVSPAAVTQLSKAFWMTHVPLFVWLAAERLCGFLLKLATLNYPYVDILFCYIHCSYACVNTVALCRSSSAFADLLRTRVLRCSCEETGQQDVMLQETGHSAPVTQSPCTE